MGTETNATMLGLLGRRVRSFALRDRLLTTLTALTL